MSKLSVKNRLSFSILDMDKCRSLKCRVILANPSIVSKEILHSFNWSLLEISVMERVSVLSQKATPRHRCKKARALFLVIWWIALFKHLSPLNYVNILIFLCKNYYTEYNLWRFSMSIVHCEVKSLLSEIILHRSSSEKTVLKILQNICAAASF